MPPYSRVSRGVEAKAEQRFEQECVEEGALHAQRTMYLVTAPHGNRSRRGDVCLAVLPVHAGA
jgi:hypothetical protein